jgi:hypothetical protein
MIPKLGGGFMMRKSVWILIVFTFMLGFAGVSSAETVGFDYGVNYLASPSGDFDKGTGNYFSLVFALENNMTAAVYHESTTMELENNAGTVELDIDELRLAKSIAGPVAVILGIGKGSDGVASGIVSDVGVKYTAISSKGKVSTVNLDVNLLYRFFEVTQAAATVDYGGAIVGLNMGVMF